MHAGHRECRTAPGAASAACSCWKYATGNEFDGGILKAVPARLAGTTKGTLSSKRATAWRPAEPEDPVTYTAEINRLHPSCFLFLIDQSGSMVEAIDAGLPGTSHGPLGNRRTKAQGVADAINRLLQNLVIKCAKSDGVRDYYSVGVIGYGVQVGPAFGGPLSGSDLVPISEVANSPVRIEERTKKVDDGAGGIMEQTVKFPIWFEPTASGGTPMCRAFRYATTLLTPWVAEHPDSFPPIVINISDGASTDGDATAPAEALKNLATADGNALLFNAHISANQATPIEFPRDEEGLPDQYAHLLYRISSPLPDYMLEVARQEEYVVADGARGFVFNADLVSVIRFLDIGTRPSNLR
jgi:hypothetical protein